MLGKYKQENKKILVLLIALIIIINFIIPNYSFAVNTDITDQDAMLENIPKFDDETQIGEEDFTSAITNILNILEEEEDEEEGGILFAPISQFLLSIADGVMATMQGAFIGNENILNLVTSNSIEVTTPGHRVGLIEGDGVTLYSIKYSPAAIFSGEIPALDVNFFEPMGDSEGNTKFYNVKTKYDMIKNTTYAECKRNLGAPESLQSVRDKMSLAEIGAHIIALVSAVNALQALANTDVDYDTLEVGVSGSFFAEFGLEGSIPVIMPADLGIISTAAFTVAAVAAESFATTDRLKDKHLYYRQWEYQGETYFFICESELWIGETANDLIYGTLYKVQYEDTKTAVYEKTSSAFILRPVIATWYVALRSFALVGLLSVLVYVGIRIMISSKAEEKAKYKKMLVDWFVAVCILFVLHYLMVFIVNITQTITEVFNVSGTLPDGTDVFFTKIRNMASGDRSDSYLAYFGTVVIYLALTILTVVFTIQYIKRLIMLAFLTIISPLIALTYPIDKISDSKAQAFSFWIKEYVFNSLLQPLHLILYTIFISGATAMSADNPVYAVIALAFFIPAEKIFRKMFGFEKAQGISALGAATGGALVMNMLNNMKGKGSKGKDGASASGSGASSNSNNVRTTTRNGSSDNNVNNNNNNSNLNNNNNSNLNNNNNSNNNTATQTPSNANGFKALGKRAIRGSSNALKSVGNWTARNSVKATGAIAGATIGLAAEVADGDFENPLKNIAIGAGIGATASSNFASNASNFASNTVHGAQKLYNSAAETFQRGKYGDEAYNNMQFDKKFYASDAYKQILKDPSINQTNIKVRTQEFLDNGITDGAEIRQALQNDITGDRYKELKSAGIDSVKKMKKIQDSSTLKGLSGEDIKYQKIIADAAKNRGISGESDLIRFAQSYGIGTKDVDEARKFANNIKELLLL